MNTSNNNRFLGRDQTKNPQFNRVAQLSEDIETMATSVGKALSDAGAAKAEIQAIERKALELSADIKKANEAIAAIAASAANKPSTTQNHTDC